MSLLLMLLIRVLLEERWVAAGSGVVVAALLGSVLWPWRVRGKACPVALLLGTAGEIRLQFADGSHAPVQLAGGSLFIGRGALLVLRGPRNHRLWLGPSNLEPAELAALRRWLSGHAARSGRPGGNILY